MNNLYFESWKEKKIDIIEKITKLIPKNDHHIFFEFLENAYISGYYDGLETQETKTSEYNWNKWNQK